MKKLKLNLDDLRVESFATTPDPDGQHGTVFGQQLTDTCTCINTCEGCPTEQGDTCGEPTFMGCCVTGSPCQTDTCYHTCPCGFTYWCATGIATDCPGQTNCPPYTEGETCYGSCTDQGCTACGAVC